VIDRAEDDDADARPPEISPADAEQAPSRCPDPPPAGCEQRAAACRRYQETVDHTYDVARGDAGHEPRQSWAEAVTELRAAWDHHQQRYPERSRLTPSIQPDGSWRADGDRRLTPEQNAEAGKACEDIRAEGREVILPAMERVEAADPDRRLAGLEHMLKGEDRLKEKVAERLRYNSDWTPEQALSEVPDAVRFTLAYNDDRYTDGVREDVGRLQEEGFELIKLKNLWMKEQYKGINTQWRTSETGGRFEVQFHTPTSLEAKELTHKAYERLRSPDTNADEVAQLEDYQRRANRQIPIPPNVSDIEDYPPERHHG
jgi:hypothetical protein